MARIASGYYNSGTPKGYLPDPHYDTLGGTPYERIEYWWPDRTWRRVRGIEFGKRPPPPRQEEQKERRGYYRPSKYLDRVRRWLEEYGPATHRAIRDALGISPTGLRKLLRGHREIFVVVGQTEVYISNEAYRMADLWGVVGVHTPPKEK